MWTLFGIRTVPDYRPGCTHYRGTTILMTEHSTSGQEYCTLVQDMRRPIMKLELYVTAFELFRD